MSGLWSIIKGAWSTHTWIFFGICCAMFALWLFVYQTMKKYTLVFASIIMIILAASSYELSIGSVHDSAHLTVLNNIIGVFEGWALIWTLYVIGQMMIINFDISRKSQNICFFIAAIVLIILRVLSPHLNGHINIVNLIGFLIMSIILLIICFMAQKNSLFT